MSSDHGNEAPEISELERRLGGLPEALRWTLSAAQQDLETAAARPIGTVHEDVDGTDPSESPWANGRGSGHSSGEGFFSVPPIYDVAGVGTSRLPAMLLVEALTASGLCARLRPLGEFAHRAPAQEPAAPATELVVFSQGLSPNARLALAAAARYRKVWLVTAIEADGQGEKAELLRRVPGEVRVIRHAPASESGSLLRVVGPLSACLAALLLARTLTREQGAPVPQGLEALGEVPRLVGPPPEEAFWQGDPLAWITAGLPVLTAESLAWAWQEGLRVPLAPAFDALSFAHGPLQSFHERSGVVVLCVGGRSQDIDLARRVQAVLTPERHQMHILRSELSPLVSPIVLHANVYRELFRHMRVRGVDPAHWPAQNTDAALYRFGE